LDIHSVGLFLVLRGCRGSFEQESMSSARDHSLCVRSACTLSSPVNAHNINAIGKILLFVFLQSD